MSGTESDPGAANIPEILSQGEFAMVAASTGAYLPPASWRTDRNPERGAMKVLCREITELRGRALHMVVLDGESPNNVARAMKPGLEETRKNMLSMIESIRDSRTTEITKMRNQTTILNWRNFLAPLVLHPAMCLYPASNEEATAQREKLAEKAYESATRPLPRILDRLHKFEWSGGDANQGNNDIGNFNGQAHEQTILALLNFKDPTSSTYSKDSIALPTLPVEEDLGIDATFIRYEGETPVAYYVQAKRPDFTKPFLWQLRRKRYPYQAIVTSVDVGNNLRATESSEVGARWETTQALALDLGGRATPADQARVKRYASQVQQLVRQTAQPFEIKP